MDAAEVIWQEATRRQDGMQAQPVPDAELPSPGHEPADVEADAR